MNQDTPEGKRTDFPSIKLPGEGPKITSIFDFTAEALGELMAYIAQNPPPIPITQVIGFAGFVATQATVLSSAGETTTSTTYANLSTTGPQLTGLADGKYILFYGATAFNSGAGQSIVSAEVNSTAASDDDWALNEGTSASSIARAVSKTLANGGNNTVTLKYRVSSGTGTYTKRWLIAYKYANP